MARLSNAILNPIQGNTAPAYSRGNTGYMLDLVNGGQNGWSPNLVEWGSNQAGIRRNLVCILLEAPGFFQLMPNPSKWVATLKALVELHMKTWDGFKGGLEVTVEEHAVGGGGEMQQEYTDVKRARSEPVSTVIDKVGNPIQNFLYKWITYGMMDPDTKFAMVGTLDGTGNGNTTAIGNSLGLGDGLVGKPPADLLADWYSMSCLFFEPDALHRKVMKSWVTTNMWPKGTGEIIGKRDLTQALSLDELSIEWTGLSQFNLGGNLFAQQILDRINIKNANPYLRPSFITNISSDISSVQNGYDGGAEDLGSQARTYTEQSRVPTDERALVNNESPDQTATFDRSTMAGSPNRVINVASSSQ